AIHRALGEGRLARGDLEADRSLAPRDEGEQSLYSRVLADRAAHQLPQSLSESALAARYGAENLWAMAGDLRDTATIEKALAGTEAALGPIHGAVANVGLHPCPPGAEVDDETWDAGFSQNLGSAWRLARGAYRRMEPRRSGSILFISSIAGLGALGTPMTYGTAKAAMNHMAKELAKITGPANVRVNAIAPGNIIFPGGTWQERMDGPRAANWQRWIDREVPMKRYGLPEEIGTVAAFLMSDRASFVHGAIVPVDGGQTR
ncbi:MAG: SDR family NAD(P)-dependent oxidoreductase, partial [Caulobacter sp.]